MLQDVIHALRQLRLNPAFFAIAICVIALGIGANTAMFSVINAVILRPLPYENPDRLVMLWETQPDLGAANNVVSAANYLDCRARSRSFDAMSAMLLPSRPEDFHHRPLTEPCVRVSPYTARRGFENAALWKRPLSGGKTVRPGCPVDHNSHPTTSSALLHLHYRGFPATIG